MKPAFDVKYSLISRGTGSNGTGSNSVRYRPYTPPLRQFKHFSRHIMSELSVFDEQSRVYRKIFYEKDFKLGVNFKLTFPQNKKNKIHFEAPDSGLAVVVDISRETDCSPQIIILK